jgi:putative ABC transport system permease protein
VLLAVGLGSFFIIGVRSLQENLIDQFAVTMTPDSPDMFLLDIQRDQVRRSRRRLPRTSTRRTRAAAVPVLRARVVGVAGRELNLENYEDVRGRGSLGREYTITYRDSSSRTSASWPGRCGSRRRRTSRSVDRAVHQRAVQDQRRRHGPLRRPRPRRCRQGHQRPARRVVGQPRRRLHVRVPAGRAREGAAQLHRFLRGRRIAARAPAAAALVAAAPNVSVIDGREIIDAIKSVVDNVTLAVTVVGTLVVLSGLMILIGAVAMTKFRASTKRRFSRRLARRGG